MLSIIWVVGWFRTPWSMFVFMPRGGIVSYLIVIVLFLWLAAVAEIFFNLLWPCKWGNIFIFLFSLHAVSSQYIVSYLENKKLKIYLVELDWYCIYTCVHYITDIHTYVCGSLILVLWVLPFHISIKSCWRKSSSIKGSLWIVQTLQEYIKESDNLVSLHEQIRDCDNILSQMETLLSGFQVFRLLFSFYSNSKLF